LGKPHQYEKNNRTPFLLNTIYSETYTEKKSDSFKNLSSQGEYTFWQQNGANAIQAKNSMAALCSIFGK
jgi:hypothetical protein